MKLGCIGDDFTGSSDLANTLAKAGMSSVQYVGTPNTQASPEVDAGVVALKSRSIPVEDAIAQSLAALTWLQAQGCQQFFFKYCSTFDSTPQGNIGPVAEALADVLNAECVIVCPAFPGTGRSLYQGHLFVNDQLLSASGMEAHPLTPMTDPDIRRWLALQSQGTVGHVAAGEVFAGAAAIAAGLSRERKAGHRLIVVDAIRDEDLFAIGAAAGPLKLVTGGSGVAMGLPANYGCVPGPVAWRAQKGRAAALSGSCSTATRAQVARHKAQNPAQEIDVARVLDGSLSPRDVSDWLLQEPGIPLAYSSADPATVASTQAEFGRERTADALEKFFAEIARQVVAGGVTRLITAGGETSGAVVEGLALNELAIGPEIDPGVPALRAGPELTLALKSGNFGDVDFFQKAAGTLAGEK
ncbi:MAG: 3-oxo-tetronate kinase [Pseudomonadota bacterium]